MKYPEWLYGPDSFMKLPKAYQEYFVRWYYYENTDETNIPDTIPVENIENYIAERCEGVHLWCAKGFAAARNVDDGDNLDFKNDSEYCTVLGFCTKMIYKMAIENNWFNTDITEKEFNEYINTYRDIEL
jgi:hypothetical protein